MWGISAEPGILLIADVVYPDMLLIIVIQMIWVFKTMAISEACMFKNSNVLCSLYGVYTALLGCPFAPEMSTKLYQLHQL
jgi:hypothetical protein